MNINFWKFCKDKSLEERYPAKDEYQSSYRKEFGGIVDKYLILYESNEDDSSRIIYIDCDNDVEWIEQNISLEDEEILKQRTEYLAKLDIAQALPYLNLSEKNILKYKIMLGAGYNATLHGKFELVQSIIDDAIKFLDERNKEQSRLLMLFFSTLITFLVCVFAIFLLTNTIEYKEWILGAAMGVIGAYVSISCRYGKVDMTGLSSKRLHFLEALARLFCGAVFAIIGIIVLHLDLLFSGLVEKDFVLTSGLISFIAGFNERFIPSLIEKVSKNEDKNADENE